MSLLKDYDSTVQKELNILKHIACSLKVPSTDVTERAASMLQALLLEQNEAAKAAASTVSPVARQRHRSCMLPNRFRARGL